MSMRGALALARASKAWALSVGRTYVTQRHLGHRARAHVHDEPRAGAPACHEWLAQSESLKQLESTRLHSERARFT